MKASNILLTAIFSTIFLAVLGSNLVLKSVFDKVDRKDQFSGYRKEVIKPFSYVKLQGKPVGLTEIQPGKTYEIRMIVDKKFLSWEVVGDTLSVTYNRDWNGAKIGPDKVLQMSSSIYIMAPKLSGIISEENNYRATNWTSANMILRQKGGSALLSGNKFDNLTAQLQAGSYLKIENDNNIGNSNIQVRDSSFLVAEKDVFKSFKTNVDSTATISLPGGLLKKVLQ